MDEKLKILLNSEKNIESINVDGSMKLQLSNKPALMTEYNIRNVLSVTELFELERQETEIYRIYGKIEYMSLLNGLRNGYSSFTDFFSPTFTSSSKNIFNSFDFYLVRPAESGYTKIKNTNEFIRFYKVVATPNQFDLFKAGFANNLFNEQTYAFNFTVDVDISELRDEFGMPITELFLYAQYKRVGLETLSFTKWNDNGDDISEVFTPITFNVGDYIRTQTNLKIGDYVEYTKQRFLQQQITPQTFRIETPITFTDATGDDESQTIILTDTTCVIVTDDYNQLGEYYREYRQTLTFSITEPQQNDLTIFYRITTDKDGTYTTPSTSSTTGSTIIFAGQTSRTLTNVLCRIEIRDDMGAGGYEDYSEYYSYELITTTINTGSGSPNGVNNTVNVVWKYNPFIPIRLRYFENNVSRANSKSISYEEVASIPQYATNINNDNFIWREIMPEGYTDPISGVGTDHPFVNKRRYVFSTIVLDMIPDLDDADTFTLFQNLWFDKNTELINSKPINDINEMNKPCL